MCFPVSSSGRVGSPYQARFCLPSTQSTRSTFPYLPCCRYFRDPVLSLLDLSVETSLDLGSRLVWAHLNVWAEILVVRNGKQVSAWMPCWQDSGTYPQSRITFRSSLSSRIRVVLIVDSENTQPLTVLCVSHQLFYLKEDKLQIHTCKWKG